MKMTNASAAMSTICKRMKDVMAQSDHTPAGAKRVADGIAAFMGDMAALAVTLAKERDHAIANNRLGAIPVTVVDRPLLAPSGVLSDMTSDDLETIMRLAQAELDKRCRVANGKAGG